MKIVREEIFDPVGVMTEFEDEASELISSLNCYFHRLIAWIRCH